MSKSLILNNESVQQKITRLAYEILESNADEKEIHLVGIRSKGYSFAEMLLREIRKIMILDVHLHSLEIDKKNPMEGELKTDFQEKELNNAVVILVDDVANTGKTLFYAMKPLLNCKLKKLQVAVLVDRKHKQFPICSDFVGMSLSTTLHEHISFEVNKNVKEVYLS